MTSHARPYRDADYLRLKAATRRTVRAAGGVEAASLSTRVGMQRLSSYQRPHEPDFMPIDVAADLTAESGDLSIVTALAQLLGCVLVRLPQHPEGEETPWHRTLADLASRTSDVMRRLSDALADDGLVDADESRRGHIRDVVREAIECLVTLEDRLARLEGDTARLPPSAWDGQHVRSVAPLAGGGS